ncbi:MAG: hydrogenase 4 subunit B [Gammaproteobacteria bacterium RIFOXYA12_FULL_61_12]|nr:MAG: hydrogenase 4 subunit B [Gammaproteobacteria bacterium RIFOXYD12_FULL_61_37]OGT92707.1 MAG: hydrogenase 4 subunit B [Gammaproteobacteria bacterium RIFOXYA12_FULL_61_12]
MTDAIPVDPGFTPLAGAWWIVLLWLVLAFAGLIFQRRPHLITHLIIPLGALGALGMALIGAAGLVEPVSRFVLPIGLPDLPFHLRLDALSAFFLILLGGAAFGVTLYASGYLRHMERGALALLSLWYHLFLAGMVMVMLADDAYAFMVAWELMALSSYFLVTTDHDIPDIRRAGFLYLLIAHVGAVSLLLCFGVLQGGGQIESYSFDAIRAAEPAPFWSSVAFLLALFGFGAKAGLVPLHVWLPEAHPAAPSPVSALMSGVMLKTAIYGLLRVSFDLLGTQASWWGILVLGLGLITAVYGVIFAAVQSDMKRLLAWSSIENIGVILVGIGLAMIFHTDGKGGLAALALTATLYHAINHAFFKGLLFIGTGAVLHATGTRLMGELGGVMRFMPWTAWLTLIGALAIAGLPPLNGFVSEWLLLQAFLLSPGLSQPYLNMVIPVAAASIALAAALAAYVMVKFFGVVFLGQPRDPNLKNAHEVCWPQRLGMIWLALGCILLGLMPAQVIGWIAPVVQQLIGQTLHNDGGWLMLAPVDANRASYAPLIFFLVVLAVLLLTFLAVRKLYHGRIRRSDPWDCGYPEQDARMQDSAEGFGQPIRQIFESFMRVERETPDPFDRHPKYRGDSRDNIWLLCYAPIARLAAWLSDQTGRLQHGRIQWYLVYSFATLIFLLVFTR